MHAPPSEAEDEWFTVLKPALAEVHAATNEIMAVNQDAMVARAGARAPALRGCRR